MNKTPEKSRLGRGLSALIPPPARPVPDAAPAAPAPSAPVSPLPASENDRVQEVPLASIVANTLQPRTVFDEAALEELAASVATHGVLQPVMVRPRGGGRYELVAGERRFRAAEKAGLTRIPVVVREMTDEESLTVALIENIQREDLNPIEAARGYKQLMDDFHLTQSELGKQIGKKQSTISNVMSLLRLPQEIQDSIADGRLSTEHGKTLLSIDNPVERLIVWKDFLDLKMSRKDAREHAKMARLMTARPRTAPEKDIHWQRLEEQFRYAFGTRVELKPGSAGSSTLTIKCSSPEELEGILEKIQTK